MSGYTPKCDCCGRFFRAGQPGSSWSQSWSWDMGGTPDLHDPTDRCAPCTDLYGVEPSNCANPENYSGRHALEGRLPMTPPETSDQGNMVSQREGEWVLVPREGLEKILRAGVGIDDIAISAAPPAEPRADEGGVSGAETASSASPAHPMGEGHAGKGGIYTASKTAHAGKWRDLRETGEPIIATWIDEAGAGETACFVELWDRCVSEAANADCVILYREAGEVLKGALVEAGAALAAGKPVLFVGEADGLGSFLSHRRVERCDSVAHALQIAQLLVAAGEPEAALSATDTQITQPSHDDEGLIERLNKRARHPGLQVSPEDAIQAANTISRLKGERGALNSIATETYARLREQADEAESRSLQLEAEVKELREALKPFAEAGAQVPPPVSDGATCTYYRDSVFTAANFRKARSLLSPAQEGLSSARASRDARSST